MVTVRTRFIIRDDDESYTYIIETSQPASQRASIWFCRESKHFHRVAGLGCEYLLYVEHFDAR